MAKLIDPEDLVDGREAAEILGLSSSKVIAVYRGRYEDFPEPVVRKGQCWLWLATDIERWGRRTGRLLS